MGPAYLVGTFGDRELSEILGDLATNQPNLWFPEPIWAASTHAWAAARWQVGCGVKQSSERWNMPGYAGTPGGSIKK